MMRSHCFLFVTLFLIVGCIAAARADDLIRPLQVRGEDFVDAAGQRVRFWGVNLVALYPDHATSDALAANLASLQVNLARPHHNLRPSKDWNPQLTSGALLRYQGNSREFDDDALDRFDYLNNALRRNGIYLSLSINWTRRYLPGDVDILKTNDADRDAWSAAMTELNGWKWQKGFDVYKMLPVVDERSALLNEEFARKFLAHVNPYSGIAYAKDPQVLMLELMNEASTEYAVICGNRFPDYWERQLIAKWEAYAAKAGIKAGDLYKPADAATKDLRAKFLRGLDEAYFDRMKAVVRQAGCNVPMTFSNLWRGDNALQMHSQQADVIENHMYDNPLVVQGEADFISKLARSALVDKPFIVGELNQSENAAALARETPIRSMLPLATASYGSLHNWSGVVWFAWLHGGKMLGDNGWAVSEGRSPNLGQLITDGMFIDHMRTTGILFRRGLVAPSVKPITINVDDPVTAGDYNGLMRGKYVPRDGWQSVHAVRKAFRPASEAGVSTTDWMTQQPESPLVSDTGEIVKDIARSQLTVAAGKAEAFSGKLDDQAPRGLRFLKVAGSGFATAIVVADDGEPLALSGRLIVSRTATDANGAEFNGPKISLQSVKSPPTGQRWYVQVTRSRNPDAATSGPIKSDPTPASFAGGVLELPAESWTECELQLRP